MATRQYIGARYVTKVYQNSQNPGSAEWESGVTYEPLTMVTYLNNSYISRDMVPSTVGNPAENSDHWAITGFYNGQIADLQSQINEIKAYTPPKTDLSRRKFIIIGDSYVGLGLGTSIKTSLDLDAEIFAAGGGGFVTTAGTYTFLTGLQAVAATMTSAEREAVTDIMVLGGYNDYSQSAADILTAMTAFNTYVHTTFPIAEVTLGCICYSTRSTDINSIDAVVIPTYTMGAQTLKWSYIPHANSAIHNYEAMGSDGVHPVSIDGLSKYICQYLISGGVHFNEIIQQIPFVPHDNELSGSSHAEFITTLIDGVCTLQSQGMMGLVFSTPFTFSADLEFSHSTFIGTITKGHVRGGYIGITPAISVTLPIEVYFDSGSEVMTGIIWILDGQIYLSLKPEPSSTHFGASFTTISFNIPIFSVTIPSDLC